MYDFLEAAADWGNVNKIPVSFRKEGDAWFAQMTLYDTNGPWKTRYINTIPREEIVDTALGVTKSGRPRLRPETDAEYFPRVSAFLSRELVKMRELRAKRFGNIVGSGTRAQKTAAFPRAVAA